MIERREFYINGQWVAPAKARDCQVIDPSTEEPCAVISLGDQADTDAAVIMKLGRTYRQVREALSLSGRLGEAIYVERASSDGQRVMPAADVDDTQVPYFSETLWSLSANSVNPNSLESLNFLIALTSSPMFRVLVAIDVWKLTTR